MTYNEDFVKCVRSLSKTIIKAGEKNRKPSDGTVCCVEIKDISGNYGYSIHLAATKPKITIGDGSGIIDRVVEYCIQTMTVGEESCFSIHSDSWNIQFTATLDNCSFKPYCFQMSDIEKMEMARGFKDQGVDLFKSDEILHAFLKFRRSLQYIKMMDHLHNKSATKNQSISEDIDPGQVQQFLVNIYNNMAMCQLQYNNNKAVIPLCSKSLSILPNVKAYYRRALALIATEEYDKAEEDLMALLKLDRNNAAAKEKLNFVRGKLKHSRDRYNETVRKMFS